MPIDFSISLDLDILIARWTGDVDVSEYRAGFQSYLEDRDYALGRREFCDFSKITNLDADFGRIWSVLTMVNNQAGGDPVNTLCVIFAPEDVPFGLARIYQSLAESAEGVRVAVFREEAAALAHLKLPSKTVDGVLEAGRFRTIKRPSGEGAEKG